MVWKEHGVDGCGNDALLDGKSSHCLLQISDTLALLRRISLVSLLPHGPRRLLNNLDFIKAQFPMGLARYIQSDQ